MAISRSFNGNENTNQKLNPSRESTLCLDCLDTFFSMPGRFSFLLSHWKVVNKVSAFGTARTSPEPCSMPSCIQS